MKRKGFTLIELLAVIVIIAVIGLITIPIIGNVIEDSKKKALEQSVYGIVEAANYFALENKGEYLFIVDKNNKIESPDNKFLSYKGKVDASGELYIDNEGNISLCLMNDNYYVYKNYNSGIYIGNVSDDTCIIGHDAITNRYVAMLDDGSGTVSNVYSKVEVDDLVTNLQSQIDTNESNINTVTSIANTNKSNIESIQVELSNYALQSNLDETNTNVTSLQTSVTDLNTNLNKIIDSPFTKKWVLGGTEIECESGPGNFLVYIERYTVYNLAVNDAALYIIGVGNDAVDFVPIKETLSTYTIPSISYITNGFKVTFSKSNNFRVSYVKIS